jgi:Retrotransposon gag protein
MQAYVHAVKMSDRDAAEFLTLYLRGDAMTWWRSYCTTNGGLTNVFSTKSFKDLLKELRSEFSDVDREMQLRNKLFNIQ